jgi:hypothetical protein
MALIHFISNPTSLAELIAFVFSIIFLIGRQNGFWRLFIIYLFLTLFAEGVGYFMHFELQKPNYIVYNIFMIIQSAFFCYLFISFFNLRKFKLLSIICLLIFLSIYLTESIINHFGSYNKVSREYLSINVVLLSCIYYLQLLRENDIQNPASYGSFWIVTGLFFFYFGTIVMFSLYSFVARIKLSGDLSFYNIVLGTLSAIQYGAWITGFICKKKHIQSSSQS